MRFEEIPYHIKVQGSYLTKEGVESLNLENQGSLTTEENLAATFTGIQEVSSALKKLRLRFPDRHFYMEQIQHPGPNMPIIASDALILWG